MSAADWDLRFSCVEIRFFLVVEIPIKHFIYYLLIKDNSAIVFDY